MSSIYELDLEVREDVGRGASRRLRREAIVPGVIYGAGKPAESVQLSHNQLSRALKHESFYSHIITLNVGGKKQKAVLKDLHRHPYKPVVLHADFLRVSAKDKLTMHVPLHFVGQDDAPANKEGGVVAHMRNELEVSCLPADLPEFIEVDLSGLEVGHAVHLSDIKLPKGVEIVGFDEDHDHAIANATLPRAALAEDEAESAEGEAAEGGDAEANGDTEAGDK